MPSKAGKIVFWIMLALQGISVWLWPHFLTQDGPSHLENANILRLYASTPLFEQYFSVNIQPVPNWFGHIMEAGLLTIAPPAMAEKLFITGYVVLFPLAALYVICGLRSGSYGDATLVFPLVLNCLLLYGFFNFCWSMCFFLLMAGYWQRHPRIGPRQWSRIAALGFILYFSHVFSWLISLLVAAVLTVSRLHSRQWSWRDAVGALSAFAPSAVLSGWFVWTQAGLSQPTNAVGIAPRWNALWRALTIIFSYNRTDVAIATAFGVLLLTMAAWLLLRRSWNMWALMAAILLTFYLVSPPQTGIGQYVLERWNVYVLLALVLWIASANRSRLASLVMVTASVAISVALLVRLASRERDLNHELSRYLSVTQTVDRGTTLLPVQFDSRGPGSLRDLYGLPMRHAASYIAVQRRALNLDNYEAQTNVFPLIFREQLNPGITIGHLEDEPPAPKFAGRAEYILVWDPLGTGRQTPAWGLLQSQLESGYRDVANGFLFRRLSEVNALPRTSGPPANRP